MKDVISLQQSFAGGLGFKEEVLLTDVIENVLLMQINSLNRHGITVEKNISDVRIVHIQKAKLSHVIFNLIKNAQEAMAATGAGKKILTIDIGSDSAGSQFIRITDTGSGISPDNINKIFNHGFTTKKTGHGFGLHSCANSLTEMGGSLAVHSEGVGKGASFTITFKNTLYSRSCRVA